MSREVVLHLVHAANDVGLLPIAILRHDVDEHAAIGGDAHGQNAVAESIKLDLLMPRRFAPRLTVDVRVRSAMQGKQDQQRRDDCLHGQSSPMAR